MGGKKPGVMKGGGGETAKERAVRYFDFCLYQSLIILSLSLAALSDCVMLH
jgi:hypothetical protein